MTPIEDHATDSTLRLLMGLVDDLAVGGEENDLLRATLAHVVEVLGLRGGIAYRLGPHAELTPVAESQQPTPDMAATLELAQLAAQGEQPMVCQTPQPGWLAAVPLTAQGRALGVLTVHAEAAVAMPERELLRALGKQIGTGLHNARTYTELLAASARSETLNRLARALTATDLKDAMPRFAEELARLVSFDRLVCGFVNDQGDYIEVVGHPEGATWGLGSVIPVVGSGPGTAVLSDRPVLQRDLLHSHRFIEDMRLLEEGLRSYVLVPLSARGRASGVLALGASRSGAYDEATVAHLQPLASAVSLALDNVRLLQKTRELSISDELTPLYNARFFHQILERELKLVDRYHSELSLVFMDLDRFKPVNDTYGHLRGSRVLREVGFLIRENVRDTDYPARFGGDEFTVILPQTDGQAATLLAERLRASLERHVFLQEEGINVCVGCSLGVATYPVEARTKQELIRLADERMYQDKEARRART